MSGRCSDRCVCAAVGRRVAGYDMNPAKLDKVGFVSLKHKDIDTSDMQLHHTDDYIMKELADWLRCIEFSILCPRSYALYR